MTVSILVTIQFGYRKMKNSIVRWPILIILILVVSLMLLKPPLMADMNEYEMKFHGDKVDSKIMADYGPLPDARKPAQEYIPGTENGILIGFVNAAVLSTLMIKWPSKGKTAPFPSEDNVSELKIVKNQTGSSFAAEGVSCGGTITGRVTAADRGSLMFTIDDSVELRAASDRIFRTRVRVGKRLECQTYSQDGKCIAYGCRTIEELPKAEGD